MKNMSNGWDVREFPYICFAPGEAFHAKRRAWQGCPTVAVTKGNRIFAGWYTGGAFEPCIWNYNVLAMSDDGGESWTEPVLTIGTDEAKRERKIDIELWMGEDNALWVMWTASPYYEHSKPASIRNGWDIDYHREFPYTEVMICRDPDADVLVWEKPRYLCDGFMRNKPILTKKGRIIAPGYDYAGPMYVLRNSDDHGQSFYDVAAVGKPDVNVYDETMVYENGEGRLRFLARTIRGCYVYADSYDGGDSWSEAKVYEKAPSTRCYIGRLKNGMILYVRNVSDEERTGMKVCVSEDGGETFAHELVLDTRTNLSYPDVDQDEEGYIYVVYDRERDNRTRLNRETWTSDAAKEILMCRLTVEDVLTGRLSEGSYLRKVICKGGNDAVER